MVIGSSAKRVSQDLVEERKGGALEDSMDGMDP